LCVLIFAVRACGQNPDFASVVSNAQEATAAKHWDEAAGLWSTAVGMNPTRATLWKQLANAQLEAKQFTEAIQSYKQVQALGGDFPWGPPYNIAKCYAQLGAKDAALVALEEAIHKGYRYVRFARKDAAFDKLANERRFKSLLAAAPVESMSRDEGWRFDLAFAARELKRIQYEPFRHTSEREFDRFVADINSRVPNSTDYQLAIAFRQLFRLMGTGHTVLWPTYVMDEPKKIPVEFYLFQEGLYVVSASPQYGDLLGAEVLSIGGHNTPDVLAAVDTIASSDNAMGLKQSGAILLRNPQLLNGLGLIPDGEQVQINVRDISGSRRTLTLSATSGNPDESWRQFNSTLKGPLPLYLRYPGKNYWFEYVDTAKLLYFQFNVVEDDPKEPLDKFVERLFEFANSHDVDKFVVDLRFNDGGNNFLLEPVTKALACSKSVNRRGKLFVIIGRKTFSAGFSNQERENFLPMHLNRRLPHLSSQALPSHTTSIATP
jgi:hypothetical protein